MRNVISPRRTTLPAGPRLPRAVQGLHLLLATDAFTAACRRRYGDTYTLRLPRTPVTVWSSDRALARLVTRLPADVSSAVEWNATVEFVWGKRSPFVIEGEEHLRTRRLVMPVLRGPRMLATRREITDVTRRAVAGWARDQPVMLLPRMRELVLTLIIRTVFGPTAESDPLARRSAELTEILRKTTCSPTLLLPATRLFVNSAYVRSLRARNELVECLTAAYRSRSRHDGGPGLLGDLTRACGSGRLGEEALPDQVIAFLLGGYATTATALTSTFDLLLHHPNALHQAETAAAEEADTENTTKSWLDAVVMESLRLNPPAWVFGRVLRQPVEFGEWLLPAGAQIAFDLLAMHRLAAGEAGSSADAPTFTPARHLSVRTSSRGTRPHPVSSWYVFGGGGRTCPGASYAPFVTRTVLAAVLRQVRLQSLRARPGRLTREATLLVVEDGVPVTVSDR